MEQQKLRNSFFPFLLVLLITGMLLGAEFNTGTIGIILNDYGRVRVCAPTTDTYQIDRSSLLVASGPSNVFDYRNDAETVDASQLIESPLHSDYEMWGSFDNTYPVPPVPPDVLNEVRIYGWQDGAYAVVKFRITNLESSAISARIGLEFIAQIDDIYGLETVEYLADGNMMAVHRAPTSTHVGYKFLSAPMVSAHTFDWYDGYSDSDSDYYTWLTYGDYDTTFTSLGSDGIVTVMSQDPLQLDPDVYTDLWVGISVGSDMPTMISNMDSAIDKYEMLLATSIDKKAFQTIRSFDLQQNYPNPFNPQTNIRFTLGKTEKTTLKIFSLLGEEIATLVNDELPAGEHRVQFNGADFPSGIYFYTVQAGSHIATKKMILLK